MGKAIAVVLLRDDLLGYPRIEARGAQCGSHLGHVFRGEGFPVPTDQRWCINASGQVVNGCRGSGSTTSSPR